MGRRCRWVPAVAVVEESSDDEYGRGESEGGVAVVFSAVGVAAELPVVRPPRVGGFNDPSTSERESVRGAWFGFGASALDVQLVRFAFVPCRRQDGGFVRSYWPPVRRGRSPGPSDAIKNISGLVPRAANALRASCSRPLCTES